MNVDKWQEYFDLHFPEGLWFFLGDSSSARQFASRAVHVTGVSPDGEHPSVALYFSTVMGYYRYCSVAEIKGMSHDVHLLKLTSSDGVCLLSSNVPPAKPGHVEARELERADVLSCPPDEPEQPGSPQ